MNMSNLRLYFGFAIITVLGTQVWSLVSTPLNNRLFDTYFNRAEQSVIEGDFETARGWLAQATEIRDDTRVNDLSSTINQIAVDLQQERAYMAKHGNTERVTLLDTVLQKYDSPKELLEAALTLYGQHEPRLAELLVHQAELLDAEYVGITLARDYVSARDS